MSRTAFITGATGQDGSYLAEYLLEKGYEVVGFVRRSSTGNTWRIDHLLDHDRYSTIEGNMLDAESLTRAVQATEPDEIYNLAAQSHVGKSFDEPLYTTRVNAIGTLTLLEIVRRAPWDIRFYQASTSELFGNTDVEPQDETTPLTPDSPYATSKLLAHHATRNYREAYDIPAVAGILFNHESPRRGEGFVTRKIARGAARIVAGEQDELRLGNLDARRDWGHARDYVRAMHLMIQQPIDDMREYVVGTGETHTIRECAHVAFDAVGLDWQDYVVVDEEFYRPVEVNVLRADASRIRDALGWEPRTDFAELMREMVDAEVEQAEPATAAPAD